jgi:hypothetical protein
LPADTLVGPLSRRQRKREEAAWPPPLSCAAATSSASPTCPALLPTWPTGHVGAVHGRWLRTTSTRTARGSHRAQADRYSYPSPGGGGAPLRVAPPLPCGGMVIPYTGRTRNTEYTLLCDPHYTLPWRVTVRSFAPSSQIPCPSSLYRVRCARTLRHKGEACGCCTLALLLAG